MSYAGDDDYDDNLSRKHSSRKHGSSSRKRRAEELAPPSRSSRDYDEGSRRRHEDSREVKERDRSKDRSKSHRRSHRSERSSKSSKHVSDDEREPEPVRSPHNGYESRSSRDSKHSRSKSRTVVIQSEEEDEIEEEEEQEEERSTDQGEASTEEESESDTEGSDAASPPSKRKSSSGKHRKASESSITGVEELELESSPTEVSKPRSLDESLPLSTEELPEELHEDEEEVLEEEEEVLPPYLPGIMGCRSVEEFLCLNKIEEGTYGVVYRAKDKRTDEVVALKRLKMEREKEGFPITSLREISTLLKAQHPNIVTVREIVVGSNMDKIFLVMDYVEHDLKSLMETMRQKKQLFTAGEVKCLLMQLLRAVAHLHDNWILHRDLKTSNLLLSHRGILKVGDFGLAREYGSPLKPYTSIVVTLWYRAPELLLGIKEYSTPIDVWSVGCIFGELLLMEAMFPGKSEVDQLNKIFKDLGTPTNAIWPGYDQLPLSQKMTFTNYPVNQLRKRFGAMFGNVGLDLMNKFLTYDPTKRITAEDALRHSYFEESPLPIDPSMFPTWPAKSEMTGAAKKAIASPKPPSGGKEYKQLGETDDDIVKMGFHMGGEMRKSNFASAGFSLKF